MCRWRRRLVVDRPHLEERGLRGRKFLVPESRSSRSPIRECQLRDDASMHGGQPKAALQEFDLRFEGCSAMLRVRVILYHLQDPTVASGRVFLCRHLCGLVRFRGYKID